MKKLLVGLFIVFLNSNCHTSSTTQVSIRIGWQQVWATQGQIAQTLQNTDILNKNGLKGKFVSFSYGAPLAEAAVAGELDVAFVADQPMINIIRKTKNWKIVARLNNFRSAFLVPPNSKINTINDIKGKVIAVPFGSSSHRTTLKLLKQLGITPGQNIELKNLDIAEMAGLIEAHSGKENWSGIDVIVAWDPTAALLEEKGLVKVIHTELEVAVVGMRNDFIKQNPDAAKRFVKSYIEALYFYSQHKDQANKWFADGARRSFSNDILNKIAAIEPSTNVKSINDINVSFNQQQISHFDENLKAAVEAKLIPEYFYIGDYIDTSYIPDRFN